MATDGPGSSGGVVFRLNAVRSACANTYELIWQPDSSGWLHFVGAIKSETPSFLATFFVSAAGVTPAFVGPIPAITPTLAYQRTVALPPMGSVGLLSILITSELHVCSAWKTVNSGS